MVLCPGNNSTLFDPPNNTVSGSCGSEAGKFAPGSSLVSSDACAQLQLTLQSSASGVEVAKSTFSPFVFGQPVPTMVGICKGTRTRSTTSSMKLLLKMNPQVRIWEHLVSQTILSLLLAAL